MECNFKIYDVSILLFLLVLFIPLEDVHCNCVLPAEFQNTQWLYAAPARMKFGTFQFTTSQLQGFDLTKAGITMTSYNCIKNVTLSETESILIFKSTSGSFNSMTFGTDYVFLCAKVTIVSNEAAYFYLLNDIQTSIAPNERVSVYSSPPTLETDQICSTYCTYNPSSTTTPVITDDVRILSQSSSAIFPNDTSLCQPCDKSCAAASVPCPTLTPVSHSTVDTSLMEYKQGDTVTYTCDEGYDITFGNETRTCMEDGTWNGNVPVCTIVSCPELSAVSDSTRDPVSSTNIYNETVTYTCNVGYEKTSGDLQRVCECDGTWSGVAPVCSIKSCPALPTVQHSSLSPASPTNKYNEVATYTCNIGYEATSGDLQRTCQANEKWTGASPVCTIKSCPALPAVAQSSLSPSSPTNNYNEEVTYTCNTGYELTSGNLQRTCQDSKQWSGTSPVCGIKSCPALTTVSHATRNPTSPTNNYNEVVAYTCNAGYEITSGNAQRTCQDDKTWSGNPPVCGIKTCPALTTVSHATRDPTSPTNNYNEVVKYTCNTGYEITSGNAQRTCQDDKTWSGNPPVCGKVDCGSLLTVPLTTNDNPGTKFNDVITYTCDSGSQLISGSLTRRCQADKTWDGSPPVCEQEKYSDTYKSTFIAVATPIASVSIVILIGAVVVYVAVQKIMPKSKHGKSSDKQKSKRRNHKKGKWWSSTMHL